MKRTPYWIRVIALTLLLIALIALIIYQASKSTGTPADTSSSTTVSSQGSESSTDVISSADSASIPSETVSSESFAEPASTVAPESDIKQEKTTMKITANGNSLTAVLADNSSAQALLERLQDGPVTVEMNDYGNFEKVGPLGFSLPTNDEPISTSPGDVILYQGTNITVYYDENHWNFTRLGKIENVTREDLLDFFGDGTVTVTFSLD